MPTRIAFDYAVLRVVPRVEREEFINAGVILFCPEKKFLDARVYVDEGRLRALWPDVDVPLIRSRLEAIPKICAGDANAGPVARLSFRQRFHWLVAPRSTILQISPVHTGLCDAPEQSLEDLFRQLVLI